MIWINLKRRLRRLWNFGQACLNLLSFLFGDLQKLKGKRLVFVFPNYQTGGAERVHLNIVAGVTDLHPLVLFSENSATANFKQDFEEVADCVELNKILSKKSPFINRLTTQIVARSLNKHARVVFSSNTNYFYQLFDHLSPRIDKIDLVHAISGGNRVLEGHYAQTALKVKNRVVITHSGMNDLLQVYQAHQVQQWSEIKLIYNGVSKKGLDEQSKREYRNVGFVGRWSAEKRPEIFLDVVRLASHKLKDYRFAIAGTGISNKLNTFKELGIRSYGEISDDKELGELYNSLDFLLITSTREGFPMVIMEGMMRGVIPIATDVGGISEHVTDGVNGFLIQSADETSIRDRIITILADLSDEKREKIARNCQNYADEHFSLERFNREYRALFANCLDQG